MDFFFLAIARSEYGLQLHYAMRLWACCSRSLIVSYLMININEKWCIRNEPMFGALYFGVGDQIVCGWNGSLRLAFFFRYKTAVHCGYDLLYEKYSPDLRNELMRFQMLCSAFDSSCCFPISLHFPLVLANTKVSIYRDIRKNMCDPVINEFIWLAVCDMM